MRIEEKKSQPLKNGLSQQQVQDIRSTLSKIKLKRICEKVGVSENTVQNVLRGSSPRISDLQKVLNEAKREVKKREKTLQSLSNE